MAQHVRVSQVAVQTTHSDDAAAIRVSQVAVQRVAAFEPPRLLVTQIAVQHVTESTPAQAPPSAPSNVAATTPADASSTITWDPATDAESDPLQYEGEYTTNGGSSWSSAFALQTFAGALSIVHDTSGISSGATVKYRVRAHDGTAYGDWAESNTITVDHNDAPSAPSNVVAVLSADQNSVDLSWDPASDPEGNPLQYEGRVSDDGGASWSPAFSLQSGLSITGIDVSGFANGSLVFQVRAHDGTSYGSYAQSNTLTIYRVGTSVARTPGTTTGLIWQDDFERATLVDGSHPYVGADTEAAPENASIVDGKLRLEADVAQRASAMIETTEQYGVIEATVERVQASASDPGQFGARIAELAGDFFYGVLRSIGGFFQTQMQTHFGREGGSAFEYATGLQPSSGTTPYNLKVSVTPGTGGTVLSPEARIFPMVAAGEDSAELWQGTPTGLNTGTLRFGLYAEDGPEIWDVEDLRIYREHRIYTHIAYPTGRYDAVEALDPAYVQLLDHADEVLAEGELGGSTYHALDVSDVSFPYDGHKTVRWLNSAREVIDEISPAEGVWGGDDFTMTVAPDDPVDAIDAPEITVVSVDTDTASFTSSALSGGSGVHAETDWQLEAYDGTVLEALTALATNPSGRDGPEGLQAYDIPLDLIDRAVDAKLKVRYRDDAGGQSPWSEYAHVSGAASTFETFGVFEPGDPVDDGETAEEIMGASSRLYLAREAEAADAASCDMLMRTTRPGGTAGDVLRLMQIGRWARTQRFLMRFRVRGTKTLAGGAALRIWDDPVAGSRGYFILLDGGSLRVIEWNNSAGWSRATAAKSWNLDEWMYMLAEADGTTFRAKVWTGVRGDEPVGWDISYTDALGIDFGAPGLANLGSGSTVDVDYMAVWTEGQTEPTSPPVPAEPIFTSHADNDTIPGGIETLAWSAPTLDADGAALPAGIPLRYDVEFSRDQVDWYEIVRNTTALTAPWDTSTLPTGTYYLRVRAATTCEPGRWYTIAVFVDNGTDTPAEIHVTELRRLEVWSEVQAAGGRRLAFIPHVIEAADERELMAEERVTLALPYGAPGTDQILEKRVLRTVYTDLTWEEWRIDGVDSERAEDGSLALRVVAVGIQFDMAHGRVQQVQANGNVDVDFDPPALAPAEHLDDLVLASPGIKPHFIRGAMGSSDPVEISYSGETPMSAARAIAAAAELELHTPRGTLGGYLVTMPAEIGSSAPLARLRYARNIRGLIRRRDTTQLATRVYPRGGEQDGFGLTIAGALWEITAISGNVVTLDGDPVAFADQLVGLTARKYGTSTAVLVTAADPDTQEVTLQSAAGLVVGDYLQFRDPSGNELLYLDRPSSRTAWGTWAPPDAVEASDVPPVDNLLRNPFLNDWTAGVPDFWALVAGAAVAQSTDRIYHRYGVASAKLTLGADGDGLVSDWQTVAPVGPVVDETGAVTAAGRPYFTAQVAFWIASGGVRLEVDVDTVGDASNIVTLPDVGELAESTERGRWIELGLPMDLHELGAKRVRVRLVQNGADATVVYLDAAQLTQTHGGAPAFYDRRASNELWRRGNLHLAEFGEPITTYDVRPIDLYRLDPGAFSADELVLGGTVLVEDLEMGATVRARIDRLARVLAGNIGETEVRVSNRPPALTRLLQQERERRRSQLGAGGGGTAGDGSGTTTPPPGGSTLGGTISNLIVSLVNDSGYYHQLTWNHNQAVQDDSLARFTVRVLAGKNGAALSQLVTGRDPKLEHAGADSVALVGSYRKASPDTVAKGSAGSFFVTWLYRLELYDGATLVQTLDKYFTDWEGP